MGVHDPQLAAAVLELDHATFPPPPARGLARTVLLGWAAAALLLTVISWSPIYHLRFPDPDDAMRLLQVRDWLAGQGWFDVSQHRIGGGSFQMHWTRLVDLPLAAVMIVLDPLLGRPWSTRVAMTVVPLVTLLVVMALGAELTRRVSDRERARWAVLLAPLSVAMIYQLRPLRIDHHGWQIALALAATVLLVGPATRRSGALIGLALATLITISMEGLPIAAAVAGVAAAAWAVDPARRAQLLALVLSLAGSTTLLHLAMRGPNVMLPACDAIAPVWIGTLALAAAGIAAAVFVAPRATLARFAALAVVAVGCALTLRIAAPVCTKGPFATLDPIVYRLWYLNVAEGLPIWQQSPGWALMSSGLTVSGLVGAVLAWRGAAGAARWRWSLLLGVQLAAFALSLVVMRASATANALALPGAAWLVQHLLTRARAIDPVLPRTLATAGALLLAAPGLAAGALLGLLHLDAAAPPTTTARASSAAPCGHGHDADALAELPGRALMFAPVDLAPEIVAMTPHRAVAAGYHRDSAGIADVMHAFLGTPDQARARVLASGADYVVGCPSLNETEIYRQQAPDGFWAQLERGERFAWLQPVPIAGSPVKAWRVLR